MGSLFVLVPVVLVLVSVWSIAKATRDLLIAARLQRSGTATTGRVISAHTATHGSSRNRQTTRLVETVEFETTGGTVRAHPTMSDVGMLDRTGTEVTVLYDHDRPERFIAPMDGSALRPTALLGRIASAAVSGVIAALILFMSTRFLPGSGLGGFPGDR